ncbi:WXG100 family type VII secretion target [Streptomyces tateyamensis]|uniref:WXG100 family type VII secretion target n=1 Tax=Streptomyces tateyamensis TaxID=565073 RepID=A0A2V4PNM6_9ACTN|nr:WXG100 family type VII secretion target [Streptomyces tateyamensis]PYC87904.1 WXG100 family type VII secretion target [Streptomyces tateyamensis]
MSTQSSNTGTGGGAMTGYRVTPDEVAAASTYVTTQAADIDTKIAVLRSYVAGLGSHWQGSAHAAFETLMADYDIYARMMHDALSDIASGLRGNYVNYAESEQANIAGLKQVQLPPARF